MANPTNNSYAGIIDWVKASNNDVIAKSAAKLTTGKKLTIADSDGTNSTASASVPTFDGSADVTLKLPATIKANITGNCSGSSGSCTGNAASASYASKVAISNTNNNTDYPLTFLGGTDAATKYAVNVGSTGSVKVRTGANRSSTSASSTYGMLTLGNSTSDSDTTNYATARTGRLRMYGSGSTYLDIAASNPSSSGTLNLPAGAGTLARTSDNITGNAATATKLKTARTISLTGDVTGSGSFDGGGNLSLSTALSSFTRITTTDNLYSYPYGGGSLINSGTMYWDVSYNNFIGIAVLENNGGIYECGFNVTANTSRAIFMKVPSVMEENFNKFILLPSVGNISYDNVTSSPFYFDSSSTSRRGACGFIISEWKPNSAGIVVRDTDWDAQMQLLTNSVSNSRYYNMPNCLSIRIHLRDIPAYLYSSSTWLNFGFYAPAVVGFKI